MSAPRLLSETRDGRPRPFEHRLVAETLWAERRLVGLLLGASLLVAVTEGFGLGLIVPFLQNLMDPEVVVFRTGVAWVDRELLGVEASQTGRMVRFGGLILVVTWLRSLLSYRTRVLSVRTLTALLHRLRCRAFEQLQRLALRYFSQSRSGDVINTLTTEGQRLWFYFGTLIHIVVLCFMLAAYLVVMLWLSWLLTLGTVALFGALTLGLTRLMRRIRAHGDAVTAANARLTSRLGEMVAGIRTVMSFGTQPYETARLTAASAEVAHEEVETRRRAALVLPLSEALAATTLIATIVMAVLVLVDRGMLSLAALLTFLFVLFRLMPVVQQLNDARGNLATARGALGEFARLLRTDDKPYLDDGTQPVERFEHAIAFEHVWFAYEPETASGDGEPDWVLRDVSITIPRGRTTALVGASGAGKSTLVDLIPRFHDPTAGRVSLDGTDLRTLCLASLRDRLAVVSQSAFVFHDTARANIAYGSPDASDEAIREAAEQAGALGFIEALPQGFETVLGDQGVRLSGGQRQRLAIARALLRDPDILILDEATSALDSETERIVQASLERLMRGRTVVVIAHRLSTVEHADHVVVLEAGRVVEQGGYAELLAQRGRLWRYHSIQFQMEAAAEPAAPNPVEAV